jgi:hypothetical protein
MNSAHPFVIVKFPEPVHPDVTPVKVHVPVIVLLVSVPARVSTLPLGVPDCTVNSNPPVTVPLVLPVSVKPPVSEATELKHGLAVLNERLLPVMVVPLLWFNVVVNENVGPAFGLVRVALQFPLTLFELPPPHATNIRERKEITTLEIRFITCAPTRRKPAGHAKVAGHRTFFPPHSTDG